MLSWWEVWRGAGWTIQGAADLTGAHPTDETSNPQASEGMDLPHPVRVPGSSPRWPCDGSGRRGWWSVLSGRRSVWSERGSGC